jgi:predicted nicotinamide N-methyase
MPASPGYLTRHLSLILGGDQYRLRVLRDLQQFSDPEGSAERAGISSSLWPLFGNIWPAGRVLAETMSKFEVSGKRILELGCGLGLSSLVLQRRHADITASDHHPLARSFLAYNAALNALPEIVYRDLPWEGDDVALGRFDLIIGSDVLYQRDHASLLAGVMKRHARRECEVVIADSGRGNANTLSRELIGDGYSVSAERCRFEAEESPPFRGRVLSYRR